MTFTPRDASAQVRNESNKSGGGSFFKGSSWAAGTAPRKFDTWTIASGDTIDTETQINIYDNATGTINGTLSAKAIVVGTNDSRGSVVVNSGGNLSLQRLFNSHSRLNAVGSMTVNGGNVTILDRIWLQQDNPSSTQSSTFTISGGSITCTNSSHGFRLWGPNDEHRPVFTINGNTGTFNFAKSAVILAGESESAGSTELVFNFGTTAGDGALTVVEAGKITLSNNPISINFEGIARPRFSTSYSTVLIRYSEAFKGSFDTLKMTARGLQDGESATLTHDTKSKTFSVNYTLKPKAKGSDVSD